MDASKSYMKDNGILNRISFQDGAAHTVKLLKDKLHSIPDPTSQGGKKEGMMYLVEEGGEQRTFFTGSIGLISKLALCEEGDVVTIQMKKANNKSFFVVTKDGTEVIEDGEEAVIADDEEAPLEAGWG